MTKLSIVVPVFNNEKYIFEALDSVKNQGRDDIELIVVNDGSTDRTPEILSSFAEENSFVKYISQENQGVSAARNAALDQATGEYIGFLDGDDIYRENALNDMLFIADEYGADLVIGEAKSVGTFTNHLLPQCRSLSRKVYIDKYDTDLVYNFSVCNKIFKREIIEQNHIRFQKIKHAEDGLFLFDYLNHCSTICGCPMYIYEYRKRVAIDDQSSLKSLNISMLESILTAADKIYALIKDYPAEFREEFNKRILRVTLINEYYRRLWILDEEAEKLLWQKITEYRSILGEDFWDEIINLSDDIELGENLKTKEDISKNPLVSVIIPYGLNEVDYRDVVKSTYYQLCPNFELIADERYTDATEKEYTEKINFHFCKVTDEKWLDLLNASRGRLIQLIDAPCVADESFIRNMARGMQRAGSRKDFTSGLVRAYADGLAYKNVELEKDFILKKRQDIHYKKEHGDFMWMNKMIWKDSLMNLVNSSGIDVSGKLPEDSRFLYKSLTFKRSKKNVMGVKAYYLTDRNYDLIPRTESLEYTDEDLEQIPTSFEKFLLYLYKFLSIILPVNRKKVLFLSDIRAEIGGNYTALYDELVKNGFEVVCDFTRVKSQKVRKKRLLKRVYNEATAGFIVLEDFHKDAKWLKIRKNQELVQLWHAAGAYKKFAWSRVGTGDNIRIIAGYEKTTKAIVSSDAIRGNYAEAYSIDIDKVYATGLPRTDMFFDEKYKASLRAKYDKKYPVLKNKKILLIAPTYRGTTLKKATYDYEQLDPVRLHEALGDDYIMVFKWHPAHYANLKKKKRKAYDLTGIEEYAIDLSRERDINDLMIISDAMITDYSSVIFEYELLHKPVIYYWYDVNFYKLARGMYYDLNEYVYGKVAYNFDQLLEAVKEMDMMEDRRKAFHDKFMNACDGHSSEKVVKTIFIGEK